MSIHIITITIILMQFISCVPIPILGLDSNAKSELSFKGAEDKDDSPFKKISQQKLGEHLYKKRCQQCHTNQSTQRPTKLDRSSFQIGQAIKLVSSMSHLKFLSQEELDQISLYLLLKNHFQDDSNSGNSILSFKQPLGTRSIMISKLKEIFLPKNGNRFINTTINKLISQAGYFGGTCNYKFDTCQGSLNENIFASMLPSDSVARRGYMINICQEILSYDIAIETALAHVYLNDKSLINSTNIIKIYDVFNPGLEIPDSSIKAIVDMGIKIKSKSPNNEWKFVLYTLCTSATFEIF